VTPRLPSPESVAFWQALLVSFDATVAVTGEMDEATETATAEWQRAAGVKATGKPDAATWKAAAAALDFLAADGPEARPELAEGDRGRDVAYLQRRLNAHRNTVEINGVFDQRVVRAVKAFQSANGLDPTGVVEAGTWLALE
jgi:peptidoglycan hydrolase-like protein with peptidoglycan-binding domain